MTAGSDGFPRARSRGLVVESVGDELVVYDRRSQTAHSLSPVAAAVWRACDGVRSHGEISSECGVDPAVVELTLDSLAERGLLSDGSPAGEGIRRREALARLAKAGGAVAIAAPIITVVIPPAIAAASTVGTATISGTGGDALSYSTTPAGDTGTIAPDFGAISIDREGNVPPQNLSPYVATVINFDDGALVLQCSGSSGALSYVFTDSTTPSYDRSGTVSAGSNVVFEYTSGDSISLHLTLT